MKIQMIIPNKNNICKKVKKKKKWKVFPENRKKGIIHFVFWKSWRNFQNEKKPVFLSTSCNEGKKIKVKNMEGTYVGGFLGRFFWDIQNGKGKKW